MNIKQLHGLGGLRGWIMSGVAAMVIAGGAIFAQETGASGKVTHRFLKCGCGGQSVAIVGKDGVIEWEYKTGDECSDAWMLPGGNIIYSFKKGVRELKPDKTTAWEYLAPAGAEVHSCQPLPEGRFLLGESTNDGSSNLHEMDREKKIHRTIKIQGGGNAHNQFRQVRKTPQGTYLVTYQRGGGKACEYDAAGKLLRTFPLGRYVAVRLPNGNTLISGGDDHRIIEVDTADKIVWELKAEEVPGNKLAFTAGIQRLANGNTVVVNWLGHLKERNQPQVFEITRDKKVVWEVNDKKLSLISSIQILDEDAEVYRLLR